MNKPSLYIQPKSRLITIIPSISRINKVFLTFPKEIIISRNNKEISELFSEAETRLKSGEHVVLNFHDTTDIDFGALTYLIGNVYRLMNHFGERITGTYSRDQNVNRLFIDSGFLKILRIPEDDVELDQDLDLIHIKFRSGKHVDPEIIRPLQDEVTENNILIPEIHSKKIFRALSEAMLNIHHHAYNCPKLKISKKYKDCVGRWWLGAQYNRKNEQLVFAIYDVGQGIPSSMPRNYGQNYLKKFAQPNQNYTDADLIRAAAEKGKTSTKKRHRGKGIPDMHQIIRQTSGELKIFSGYGHYYHSPPQTEIKNLSSSLLGTLAIWTIDVKSLGI